MLELTVSYETHVADAVARKRQKYQDIVESVRASGYRAHLVTLAVG